MVEQVSGAGEQGSGDRTSPHGLRDCSPRPQTTGGEAGGVNMVRKAASLMRSVGRLAGPAGVSTAAIARDAGVPRPTAHRILTSLTQDGFVDRDKESGGWLLGPELHILGIRAAPRYDISRSAKDLLDRLSQETGESAVLYARRGDETICLLREEGSFPFRAQNVLLSNRFPLGVGATGMVILAHLSDVDRERYLATADLEAAWGPQHAVGSLRERLTETRRNGWAIDPATIYNDNYGVAAAVFDSDGNPGWALGLTGVGDRFTPRRARALGRLLLETAHQLTRRVAS